MDDNTQCERCIFLDKISKENAVLKNLYKEVVELRVKNRILEEELTQQTNETLTSIETKSKAKLDRLLVEERLHVKELKNKIKDDEMRIISLERKISDLEDALEGAIKNVLENSYKSSGSHGYHIPFWHRKKHK